MGHSGVIIHAEVAGNTCKTWMGNLGVIIHTKVAW